MNAVEFLQQLERSQLVSAEVVERLRSQIHEHTDVQRVIELLVQRKLAKREDLERLRQVTAEPDDDLELLTEDDTWAPPPPPPAASSRPAETRPDQSRSGQAQPRPVRPGTSRPDAPQRADSPRSTGPAGRSGGRSPATPDGANSAGPIPPDEVLSADDIVVFDDEPQDARQSRRGDSGSRSRSSDVPPPPEPVDPWADPLVEASSSANYPPVRRSETVWSALPGLGRRKGWQKVRNSWDSPLILWGGGALALLLALLVGLLLYLNRGNADQLVSEADKAYQSQNYGEAVTQYRELVNRFESHPEVSHARVRIALAKVRQAMEVDKNLPGALQVAQQELPGLVGEERMPEAQEELAGMLPNLLKGFSDRAAASADVNEVRQNVEHAQQTLELIDNPNYLPSSQRQSRQPIIDGVLAELEGARRVLVQDERLQDVLTKMKAAAEARQFSQAHQLARELTSDFPALLSHAELQKVWQGLTELERQAAVKLDKLPAPEPGPTTPDVVRQVTLSATQGSPLANLSDATVVPFLLNGAVYGVRASNGELVWRRFIGVESTAAPLDLAASHGVVGLMDVRQQKFLLCNALDGSVKWQLTCPSTPLAGTLSGDAVWLTCRQGEMLRVKLDSGEVTHGVQLPLPLAQGASLTADQKSLLVLAEYGSAYQLAADTGECQAAAALGHLPGSVATPLVTAGRFTVCCENLADGRCRVRLLPAPLEANSSLQFELAVPVYARPVVDEGRLLVTGERGAMLLVEVGTAGQASAPKQLLVNSTPRQTRFIPRGILMGNTVWVVEQSLQQYKAVIAQGRLADQGAVVSEVEPWGEPQIVGNHLLLPVRLNHRTQASVIAVSTRGDELAQVSWQTDLSTLPLDPLVLNSQAKAVEMLTVGGDWFRVTADAIRTRRVPQPAQRLELPGQVRHLTAGQAGFDAKRVVYGDGGQRGGWAVATLGNEVDVKFVTAAGMSSGAGPVALWQDGLLVGSERQVNWLVPDRGTPRSPPWVPPTDITTANAWRVMMPCGDGTAGFLAADAVGHLYHVNRTADAQPLLQLVRQVDLQLSTLPGGTATAERAWLVTEVGGQAQIITVRLNDLAMEQQWKLAGSCPIPPQSVGSYVVAADSSGGIHWWSADQAEYRTVAGSSLMPVGRPFWHDQQIWVAYVDGQVAVIDPQEAKVVRTISLGEPLAAGPIVLGKYLMAVAGDGTLCVVSLEAEG